MSRPFKTIRLGDRQPARGFTLLEMMIVLALLALVVAAAWPSLRRPMLRSATQEAAQQLVEDLGEVRLTAIESGQVIALRFQMDGSRYEWRPVESLDDSEGSSEPETDISIEPIAESDEFGAAVVVDGEAALDEDVVFGDSSDLAELNSIDSMLDDPLLGGLLQDEMSETQAVETLVDHEDDFGEQWSSPVLFYPTGRAENAEFVLLGPDGYSVVVKLRGLTGGVEIGPVRKPYGNRAVPSDGMMSSPDDLDYSQSGGLDRGEVGY